MNLTQRLTATDLKKKKPNKIFWWNKFMLNLIPQVLKDEWTVYIINVKFILISFLGLFNTQKTECFIRKSCRCDFVYKEIYKRMCPLSFCNRNKHNGRKCILLFS